MEEDEPSVFTTSGAVVGLLVVARAWDTRVATTIFSLRSLSVRFAASCLLGGGGGWGPESGGGRGTDFGRDRKRRRLSLSESVFTSGKLSKAEKQRRRLSTPAALLRYVIAWRLHFRQFSRQINCPAQPGM